MKKKPKRGAKAPHPLFGKILLTGVGTVIRGGQSEIVVIGTMTIDDSKVTVIKAKEKFLD
jgi:hypothetical protein